MTEENELIENEINLTIDNLKNTGLVKIKDNNTISIIKKNEIVNISLNEFLFNPTKYVTDEILNFGLLLISYTEQNNIVNMKKIIQTKKISSLYYDSAITHILSNEINIDSELLQLLYDEISVNLRELLLTYCISSSCNEKIIDWVFEVIDNEPYLEIDVIFKKIETVILIDYIINKIIERNLFDILKEDLFIIMSQDYNNLQKFIELNKTKCNIENLSNIDEKIINQVLLITIILNENEKLCDLLLNNYNLNNEEMYNWFSFTIMNKKFKILDFILKKNKISHINKKCIEFMFLIMKDKIDIDVLNYLYKIRNMCEIFDLKMQNNILLRNAIINKKLDVIKFLFETNTYSSYEEICKNELLFETLNYFANDEITDYIAQFFKS